MKLVVSFFVLAVPVLLARDYRPEEVDDSGGHTLEKITRLPVTGTVRNYSKDRQLIAYVEYKDGKQNGKEIHWYPTGIKRHEVTFVDGEKKGAWIFWHPDGSLMAVHSSDSSVVYNSDGRIKEVVIYRSATKQEIEFQKKKG